MNNIPESGYTVSASSAIELETSLLNQPGERFGQGNWNGETLASEFDRCVENLRPTVHTAAHL